MLRTTICNRMSGRVHTKGAEELTMRLKVIACEVLTREFCLCAASSPHVVDLEFTQKDAHENSAALRGLIQEKIDGASEGQYDAILLGYGLCGNGTVGLVARSTQLVLPRAHDC